METRVTFLLLMLFILAAVLVAYETGRSTEPPVCPECQHCRERRLERERRMREAEVDDERFRTALRRLAMPAPDSDSAPVAASHGTAASRRRSRCVALRKILVAYDGSASAMRALDLAVQLAGALGARLSVVSVVPLHSGRMPIDPCDDREVHAHELLDAQELAARHGISVELVEPVGEPARAIEQAAEAGGFDAVLVGSGDAPAWLRALRGSVSARLVAHSAKTVIVVH